MNTDEYARESMQYNSARNTYFANELLKYARDTKKEYFIILSRLIHPLQHFVSCKMMFLPGVIPQLGSLHISNRHVQNVKHLKINLCYPKILFNANYSSHGHLNQIRVIGI